MKAAKSRKTVMIMFVDFIVNFIVSFIDVSRAHIWVLEIERNITELKRDEDLGHTHSN